MRSRISTFLPLLLIVFVAACSGNRVRVLSFSPAGEVEPFTTFQIDFSEPLAPEDKLEQWLEDEFVTFEPKIQGKFKWITPASLIFSPEKPLLPGQDYSATVNDAVLFGKKDKKSDFDSYNFHSPYFDTKSVDLFWTQIPHSEYKVSVQANLFFNYDVDPMVLSQFLEVSSGGEAVRNFKVVTKEASDVIAIDFGEQQQAEKDRKFKITVKKGMKSTVASRAMEEDRSFDVILPAITKLVITSVSSGFDGTKGWIEIHSTQAVDDEKFERYIELNPDRKYKTIFSGNVTRMEAAFEPGSMVDLVVKKGLPGLYGGKLEQTYTQTLVMADLAPKLAFADKKGQYLMRGGEENLKVQAVNVPKAEVKIYEVFDNNLLFYLYQSEGDYYSDHCCGVSNYGSYGDDYGSEEGDYYEEEYYDDGYYYGYSGDVGNYGRLLHREVVDFGENPNRIQDFTINLSKHLDQRFRGVYVVEIRDDQDYWRRDVKTVSVSNLGIIAKRSAEELMVFVSEISTTNPVAGAEIALISTNNQPLLTGRTDAQGIAHFKDIASKLKDFTPRLIAARHGQDFNFIDFAKTEVGLSRFEVGGKHEYSATYDAFLYADRNLFRPGETAHFNTIVRDKELHTVREIPVIFKVTDPRGKNVFESRKNLGVEGSAEVAVPLPDYSTTGDYILELTTGDGQLISSYSFSVEEFVPDKIRVEADAPKPELAPGEEVKINIFAEYLFGTPCADHSYEVDVSLQHQAFSSKKYKDYNFAPNGVSSTTFENDFSEGTLDENGKAVHDWVAPAEIVSYGQVKARAYVTVFDATGRTVSRVVDFMLHPNSYFVGVKHNQYYVPTDVATNLSFMAVDSKDKPLKSFPASIEVVRYEWRTVLKKNSSDQYMYSSERVATIEKTANLTINGAPTNWAFVPKRSGEYEVRVRKQGEDRYTSTTFYAYGFASTTSTSFEVDREGRIEIVADKETYEPGQTANLLFKAPFSGKMLVTVERERLMEHFVLPVEKNSASMSLPITDKLLPNVFISATLIRPHTMDRGTPFFVGHGYLPIRVEKKSNRIPVEIVAPERIKPRTTQEIIVKTNANEDVFVTLAMVDEGILQIKNYKSPDPYAYMYANRKLSVSSYDLYDQLLEESPTMGSSVAGGDESGAKRLNPITAKRFKLLSFWSGERRTNGNGEARISVQIPQFNGSARLMAVAYSGQRFGGAEKRMNITDDVVVMPSIPRFLAPQDSLMLPVSLMNTTTKSGNVTVTVKTTGPLAVTGKASQSINMGSKDNKNLKFGIKASNGVGVAKIMIQTNGLDNSLEEVEIAVRPTSPLVVEEASGSIKAGETKTIQIPGDFVASTQNTKLSISKYPALKYAGHLEYLVGYPHGCVEQTTSKLFPQIYLQDLVTAVAPKTILNGNPVYFVNEGITKLQSFQLGDGSLGYWQGESSYNWWGSVYAAHFLVEAKKAGFKVPDAFLDRLLGFLARQSTDKSTYTYNSYTNGKVTSEVKARKEAIYTLYVLAAAGKGDLSLMNYYRARPHLLTGDMRYMLAGAYALMNQWSAYREVLPEAYLVEHPVRETGGSFDSEVRANAIILSVLLDVDPQNKQIPGLVRYLASIPSRDVYSTQDRSWTLMALGKAAGRNAKAKVKVDVSAGGKPIGVYDNDNFVQKSKDWGGKSITLKASGEGSVYYFWNTEGVKAAGDAAVKEVDNNVKVRRKWYTRSGTALGEERIKIGDLVVCQIEITTALRSVENLAITDLLPAGFEIENPRLGESTSLNWIKPSFSPAYTDVRDDRMLLFGNMPAASTRSFYYMVRAVNAGRYRVGPIGCEAMYDPEFRSYNGARWVYVDPR